MTTNEPMAQCADCAIVFPFADLKPVRRYWERVDENDGYEPDGDCPFCGALAYRVEGKPHLRVKPYMWRGTINGV